MSKRTEGQCAGLKDLSAASRRLFRRLVQEYEIADLGGLEVLKSGLHSLESAEAAEKRIEADGAVLTDRWGQLKAHPLLPVARDNRAAWQSALKALNLSIGEQPKLGRPEGR
jgi:hypothetical protein